MDAIRVGVIGVGRMGQRHCRVYSNLCHTRFTGVYDLNSNLAGTVAAQYGVVSFSNLEQLLEQVDAVTVAASTPAHFSLARTCLEAGVHVLIEKPVTQTTAQAEELVKLGQHCQKVALVGHLERFNPVYTELKNVVAGQKVLAIDLRRLSPYAGSNLDVDVISDLMIHDIDLSLNLTGDVPTSISAFGLAAFTSGLDYVVANMAYPSGPLVTMTASRATENKIRSLTVTALEAYVEADLLNKTLSINRQTVGEYLSHSKQGVKYRQESIQERISVPSMEPLFLELQHFLECIREEQPVEVPLEDALVAMRVVDMIRTICQAQLLIAPRPEAPVASAPRLFKALAS